MDSGQYAFKVQNYTWNFSILYGLQVVASIVGLIIYWPAPSRANSFTSGSTQWHAAAASPSVQDTRYTSRDLSNTVYEALGDGDGPGPESDEESDSEWADGTEALVEDYAASLWRSFRFSSSSSRATTASGMSSDAGSHYRPPSAVELAPSQGGGGDGAADDEHLKRVVDVF